MAKLIFINLPVSDLARATAFYQAALSMMSTKEHVEWLRS